MIDAIVETVKSAAESWGDEVSQRRRISRVDPVADAIEFCAQDLRERLARAQKASERLTPEQYAALPHVSVTPQAVRGWCRRGELVGTVMTERGWMIPRDAKRIRIAAATTRRKGARA